METIALIGVILLIALGVGAIAIKRVIYICQPNEALVFTGKSNRGPDNRILGYRVIQGGRGIRVPIFECVDRMDLTNMIIGVGVSNAYSKGGIPLTVHAVANIKIASHQPRLDNALERLLGKPRGAVMTIARETLEGNVRGVVAKLTPEEVNEDRVSFERALLDEAEHDLAKIGLSLDTLTIQSVSDDVGYLVSIGRARGAELLKNAKMAEADAKASSAQKDASNQQEKSVAQIEAQIRISRAEATRRIADAQTRGAAMVAEAQADIIAQKAKAEAELSIQKQRLEQVRRRLKADVEEPARAAMYAMRADAEGKASSILEDGKARAEALRQLFAIWKKAGPNAREIFLGHKLELLLSTMVGTISDLNIDKMTLIDSRLSAIDANGSLPMKVASSAEQIKQTLGIDLAKLAAGLSAAKP